MTSESRLEDARGRISEAGAMVIISGDGLSSLCGVDAAPWQGYREGEILSPDAFARDPELVWQYYGWRRGEVNRCEASGVHREIGEFTSTRRDAVTLLTLSADGFFSRDEWVVPIELHGSIWRSRCIGCHNVAEDRLTPVPAPPRCECGSLVRPDVVWYGESFDPVLLDRVHRAVASCDLMVILGLEKVPYAVLNLASRARASRAEVLDVGGHDELLGLATVRVEGSLEQLAPALMG